MISTPRLKQKYSQYSMRIKGDKPTDTLHTGRDLSSEITWFEVRNNADVQAVSGIFYAQVSKSGGVVCIIVLLEVYIVSKNVFEVKCSHDPGG